MKRTACLQRNDFNFVTNDDILSDKDTITIVELMGRIEPAKTFILVPWKLETRCYCQQGPFVHGAEVLENR